MELTDPKPQEQARACPYGSGSATVCDLTSVRGSGTLVSHDGNQRGARLESDQHL